MNMKVVAVHGRRTLIAQRREILGMSNVRKDLGNLVSVYFYGTVHGRILLA
jgi:hypothetical protein